MLKIDWDSMSVSSAADGACGSQGKPEVMLFFKQRVRI